MSVQHIFKGSGAPVTAPTESGHHYIDTVGKKAYLSVGTASAADWQLVGSSSTTFPLNAGILGSVSAPVYQMVDTDSGMYSQGDGNVSFAANGILRLSINQNIVNIIGDADVSGNLDVVGNISAANYPPTGNANTFAGFDGSGNLFSVDGWNVDVNSGSLNYAKTFAPDGTQGYNVSNWYIAFEPVANAPNEVWRAYNVFVEFDRANSGFGQGTSGDSWSSFSSYVKHISTGTIGRVTGMSIFHEFGNGTDPLEVVGINGILINSQMRSGVTISQNLNGMSVDYHMDSGAILSGSVTAFSDYTQIQNVHGYNSFISNPQVQLVNNNTNFNSFNSGPNVVAFEGNASYLGLGLFGNFGTFATGNYQGIVVSPNITDMNGQSAVGLNINMNNVMNSASVRSLQISGGYAEINGKGCQLNSSLNTGTDPIGFPFGLNNVGGTFTIAAGFPITGGEFGILNNLGVGIIIQDDIGPDASGLGLGVFMNGFLTQVGVAPTKTMDSLTFMGAGASVPPSFGGGTLNLANMFRAIGIINQGDSITINEMRGFYVDPVLSMLATDAWGFRCDDANAENYFDKSLAIGTATKKVTNNDIAIEIGSKKQLVLAVMTTTERNAMTPVTGAVIFNTTSVALEYYNGTSWV